MGEVVDLERLIGVDEDRRSDLPERAFTGLGGLLQRELETHGPVPPERLEELRIQAGASAANVEALSALAETDSQGRLVGVLGLTVNPTPHEFRVDGQVLYTWCAFDGIVFPIAHGWTAGVRSVCPVTGQAITVDVTPGAVTSRHPEHAVLAVAVPGSGGSPATTEAVKAAFCARNRLYTSVAAAEDATADDPDVAIVSVDDAHRFGRRLVDDLGVAPSAAATEPHACTLSPDELPARREQARRLIGGLQGRWRGEQEVRLHFTAEREPEVRAFVTDEQRCCASFDFAVHDLGDSVELVVHAPEEADALLASLYEAFTPPA